MEIFDRKRSFVEQVESYQRTVQLDNIHQGILGTQQSIENMRADFNWAIGELCSIAELQQKSLQTILTTLQSPLNNQARELRQRAEFAYMNGWYEDALSDFLQAEQHNYQDFAVHQAIGNIYLYHRRPPELNHARDYFLNAAKYATPHSSRYAAISYMFAGFTSYLLGEDESSIEYSSKACKLYPRLTEAFFNCAKFAAAAGRVDVAIQNLEQAIKTDSRYLSKAQDDQDFLLIDPSFTEFVTQLRDETKTNVTKGIQELENQLIGYYFLDEDAETEIQASLQKAKILLQKNSYVDNLQAEKQVEITRNLLMKRKYSDLEPFGEISKLPRGKNLWSASALSPDGTHFAGSHRELDGKFVILDLDSGDVISNLVHSKGHSVGALTFSSDGSLLASGSSDNTVKVWDNLANCKYTLQYHTDMILCVAFSPDDSLLAVGSRDLKISLWDMKTGQHVFTLQNTWSVHTLKFSPDGTILASGAGDGTVILWDTSTSKPLFTLKSSSGRIRCQAFSSDGLLLASGSYDLADTDTSSYSYSSYVNKPAIDVWEVRSANHKQRLYTDHGVDYIAFAVDNSILAGGVYDHLKYQDNMLNVWNIATGEVLYTAALEKHSGKMHTIFSEDSLFVLNAGFEIATWRLIYSAIPKSALQKIASRYFDKAYSEEMKQNKKWFGKNYDEAVWLYELAADWGDESALMQIEKIYKKLGINYTKKSR